MVNRIHAAILVLVALFGSFEAAAQEFPGHRSITIVVPLAPGGIGDDLARYVASGLQIALNVPVVVDNKPGHTSVAGGLVAKAARDGHTLLLINSTYIINQLKSPPPPFDFIKDFAPIARVLDLPYILVSSPSFPARNFAEFVEYSRARPGKTSYASSGIGTPAHFIGEAIKQQANLDLIHVPYRGSNPAMMATISGEVQVNIDAGLDLRAPYIRTGHLRALAVTSNHRLTAFPEVPTLRETYPDMAPMYTWLGFAAPRGVPASIVERLNIEINAIASSPEFAKKYLASGNVALATESASQFASFIASDYERHSNLIKSTGMKLTE